MATTKRKRDPLAASKTPKAPEASSKPTKKPKKKKSVASAGAPTKDARRRTAAPDPTEEEEEAPPPKVDEVKTAADRPKAAQEPHKSPTSSSSKKKAAKRDEQQPPVATPKAPKPPPMAYRNKQRVVLVASRGITARQRHLLEDLAKLLPHHRAESKLDAKSEPRLLNDVCELKSANGCLYLESRRRGEDLYAWLARPPGGPSGKFRVLNIHTMDELRLTGNCALGTRPLLCFDDAFDAAAPPHWKLVKALLAVTFGAPRGHPKSKPFFDHALAFSLIDDAVWVRHFQIIISQDASRSDAADPTAGLKLVEIGPRFALAPVRLFAGSFRGATLYARGADAAVASPSAAKAASSASSSRSVASKSVSTHQDRLRAKEQRLEHKKANTLSKDDLLGVTRQRVLEAAAAAAEDDEEDSFDDS